MIKRLIIFTILVLTYASSIKLFYYIMESNTNSEFICETDSLFSHFRLTSKKNGRKMSKTRKFEPIHPKI